MSHTRRLLPVHVSRSIAVAASVDPRTVDRLLSGGSVRGIVRDRIVEALRARGLTHLVSLDERMARPAGNNGGQ